jgi:hypothetical protein
MKNKDMDQTKELGLKPEVHHQKMEEISLKK